MATTKVTTEVPEAIAGFIADIIGSITEDAPIVVTEKQLINTLMAALIGGYLKGRKDQENGTPSFLDEVPK